MGSSCSSSASASAANSQHQNGQPTANGSGPTAETEQPKQAPLAEQDEDLIDEALADAEVANIQADPADEVPGMIQETRDENQNQPEYELLYFDGFRLRAEPIRLILHYAGVPYKETLFSHEDWPSVKESTPMGQLPVLRMGEETLCQSKAIARFLAHKFDLASEDEAEAARMDMMMDGLSDLTEAIGPVVTTEEEFEKADKWRELKAGKLKDFLEDYSSFLQENGTGYLVGNKVSWVDLAVSDFLATLVENFDFELLAEYESLRTYIEQIRAIPSIAQYVANRQDALI